MAYAARIENEVFMDTHSMREGDPTRRSLGTLELRCPPLPQTLFDALSLIERPERMEIGPVTEMVQRDPIVVARLLHTVNSAYYGLRHTIGSADRAVVMLGPVAVAGIVLGMHMVKLRSILESPAGICFQRLIRHSVATAFLTRHILEGTPGEIDHRANTSKIGLAFTAGLLHDFGKIILVYNFQRDSVELYDKQVFNQQITAEDDREIEQLVLGCDHTEAGEFAARKLNFPDVLVNVIRHHHDPLEPTGHADADRLIRATAAADLAAKAMGFAFSRSEKAADIAGHPVWSRLITLDVPRFATPDDLLSDLLKQRKYLRHYVEHLTSGRVT